MLINKIKEEDNLYLKFFREIFEDQIKNILTDDVLKRMIYNAINNEEKSIEITFMPQGYTDLISCISLKEDIILPSIYKRKHIVKREINKKYNQYPIKEIMKKLENKQLYYYNDLMKILLENSDYIKSIGDKFIEYKIKHTEETCQLILRFKNEAIFESDIENNRIEDLENKIEELSSINNSLNVLILTNVPSSKNLIMKSYSVEKILKENKCVDIRFKFDWDDYSSVIKIIGQDTNEEYEQKTPQIPLIGGAWSNFVATKCLTGQVFISSLLECVKLQLEYMVKNSNWDTKIIKHDNCFYAPFMIYRIDDSGKFSSEKNSHIEYHELLKNNYPEAYKQVINLKNDENYWEKYHDVY